MSKKEKDDATRISHFMYDPDDLVIVEDPQHPLYDKRRAEKPLTESFIRSIDAQGIIQPVVFTRDGQTKIIMVGRRRTRAAREVNARRRAEGREPLLKVPSVFMRAQNKANAVAIMVMENEQREADDEIGRAEKMQRMLNFGASVDEVAVAFGLTKQTVLATLSLLDLDDSVKAAVGIKLSATAASKLAKLSAAEQRAKLSELLGGASGKRVTVARAARAAGGSGTVNGRATPVKQVRALRDMLADTHHSTERSLLRWVTGEIDLETLGNELPTLAVYIDNLSKS